MKVYASIPKPGEYCRIMKTELEQGWPIADTVDKRKTLWRGSRWIAVMTGALSESIAK